METRSLFICTLTTLSYLPYWRKYFWTQFFFACYQLEHHHLNMRFNSILSIKVYHLQRLHLPNMLLTIGSVVWGWQTNVETISYATILIINLRCGTAQLWRLTKLLSASFWKSWKKKVPFGDRTWLPAMAFLKKIIGTTTTFLIAIFL